MKYLDSITNFFRGVSLKKATLIALIFISINFLFYLGALFRIFYGGIITNLLAQGSLVVFFTVLYLKQKEGS